MKTCSLFLLMFTVLLAACSDSSTESTTTYIIDPITYTEKIQFELTGDVFDHSLYDENNLGHFGTMTTWDTPLFSTKDRAECEIQYADSIHGFYNSRSRKLLLIFKYRTNGSTSWGNLWTDSTAMGCKIRIPKPGTGEMEEYKSISGLTTIERLPAQNPDSLFGVFAGTLRDSAGNTVTLSHGKFYVILH